MTRRGEFYQSPEELESYLQFTYCIKCGCCMAACPTLATDARYLGPMPLAAAQRYNDDTRDDGRRLRNQVTGSSHGAFRCHYAGECSRACPKGVDPAKAIQHLKRRLVLDYLHLARRKEPCEKQHGPGQGKPLAEHPRRSGEDRAGLKRARRASPLLFNLNRGLPWAADLGDAPDHVPGHLDVTRGMGIAAVAQGHRPA